MADTARRASGADYALAVGPFPAEGANDPQAPFHFALATPQRIVIKASSLIGHPTIWQPRAAKAALNLLRLTLLGEQV
jgi:hypothetical protein